MENNNGRGIFYGVIGVATLVVAIIGATFAFFAASDTGTNNAVQASAAAVDGTLALTETNDPRTNMIPVEESVMKQSYAQDGTGKGTSATDKCAGLSKAGGNTVYNLCSAYQFKVDNSASIAQTVYISLITGTNEFTNLWYALYDDKGNLIQNQKAVGSNSLQTDGKTVGATEAKGVFKVAPSTGQTDENIHSVLLPANNGTATFTIVLYIHDIGTDQTGADSGKTYTGTVSITSSDGTNNITGKIQA